MHKIALLVGLVLAAAGVVPATGEPTGGARQKFVGVWRLVSMTTSGKVNPLRGERPNGYIFYTVSGEMGAMIQPERAPIARAGKETSGQEAIAALRGYTAYFGTYTVDEKAKVVTHHRKGSVQPGYDVDVRRNYRFEPGNRLILGGVGTTNEIVWERAD
jgi:hypothetical protein